VHICLFAHVCACTYTRTHTDKHRYTQMLTSAQACTQTCAYTRANTCGFAHTSCLQLVGASPALRLAFDCLRPGGTLSSVGVNTDANFPFSPQEAYGKQLTFKCGRCPARMFMEVRRHNVASWKCRGNVLVEAWQRCRVPG